MGAEIFNQVGYFFAAVLGTAVVLLVFIILRCLQKRLRFRIPIELLEMIDRVLGPQHEAGTNARPAGRVIDRNPTLRAPDDELGAPSSDEVDQDLKAVHQVIVHEHVHHVEVRRETVVVRTHTRAGDESPLK